MEIWIKKQHSFQLDLLRMGAMILAIIASMIVIDMWTCSGIAEAATPTATTIKFEGKVTTLVKALSGMVRLARITMMFVAALLGIICGVMWYTGQQQAQGMLQKFFVAVFFIFGATAILDAILGMTIGDLEVDVSTAKTKMQQSNKQWMGSKN